MTKNERFTLRDEVVCEFVIYARQECRLGAEGVVFYEAEIHDFLRYLEGQLLCLTDLTARTAMAWLDSRPGKLRERKRRYEAVKRFYSFLAWCGYCAYDPKLHHALGKGEPAPPSPPLPRPIQVSLSDEEVHTLLTPPKTDDPYLLRTYTFLLLLLVSRLSLDKLFWLNLDQLDLVGGFLRFGVHSCAGGCKIPREYGGVLKCYLEEARPHLMLEQGVTRSRYLFLFPAKGVPRNQRGFWRAMADYSRFCGVPIVTRPVFACTFAHGVERFLRASDP